MYLVVNRYTNRLTKGLMGSLVNDAFLSAYVGRTVGLLGGIGMTDRKGRDRRRS
jgi:hypothetical protein